MSNQPSPPSTAPHPVDAEAADSSAADSGAADSRVVGSRDRERHRETAEAMWLEALAAGEPVRIAVRGSCMEPLLYDGDRVRVAPLAATTTVGQLVLARDGSGQLVCHRVLAHESGLATLAGDRSYRVEQHDETSIHGRVLAVDRGDRELELRPHPRLDALLARWHYAAWKRRGTWVGRALEAPRWRLVAFRARLRWRLGARGPGLS